MQEIRCRCGRLLFRTGGLDGSAEIKCLKCGEITKYCFSTTTELPFKTDQRLIYTGKAFTDQTVWEKPK